MQADPLLYLTVDGVFEIHGRGTVVTGYIDNGALQLGDDVCVHGRSGVCRGTVTGIEAGGSVRQRAGKGDRVGVVLRGVTKEDVRRGDFICAVEPISTKEPGNG